MPGLYENNINFLIEKKIMYNPLDLELSGKYRPEPCRNGYMTVQVNVNGKFKYAHSKYDPEKEAKKFVEGISFKETSILICFGIWFSYYAKELLAKMSPQNKLIIYEPDMELVDLMLRNVDCRSVLGDPRVKFYADESIEKFYNYIYEIIPWYDFEKIQAVILPLYMEIYKEKCVNFLRAITNTMHSRMIDKNTTEYFANMWTSNFVGNLKHIITGYSTEIFGGEFEGKPVVIVASGPSLNKNIELLKEIKDKVLIIALFTSVKVLLKHGIVPDITISVDALQKYAVNNEEEAKGLDIPIMFVSVSNMHLLNSQKNKKIHILSAIETLIPKLAHEYGKKPFLFSLGGSVACVATEIMCQLGFGEIIFIGLDLANTGDKLHAEGTDHEARRMGELKDAIDEVYVDDYYGGKIGSTDVLKSYITWFERFIHEHEGTGLRIIDATEGGALIKGMKIMTFRQAIDEYCLTDDSISICAMLDRIFLKGPMFTDNEQLKILRDLTDTFGMIFRMPEKIEYAIRLSEKLVSKYKYNTTVKQAEIDKILTELDKIDYEIENTRYIKPLISLFWDKLVYISKRERDEDEEEKLYIAKKNVKIYKEYERVFEFVITMLRRSLPGIEELIKELEERGATVG